MISASKGARRTAALKFVEEDINLPGLIKAQFEQAAYLETAGTDRSGAKIAYENAAYAHKTYVAERSIVLADQFRSTTDKVTDAALKRYIDESLDADKKQVRLAADLHEAKIKLIAFENEYDNTKNAFRVGHAALEAVTQQLNYLAISKQAGLAAVAELSGL